MDMRYVTSTRLHKLGAQEPVYKKEGSLMRPKKEEKIVYKETPKNLTKAEIRVLLLNDFLQELGQCGP
jgi:hypothetical protein